MIEPIHPEQIKAFKRMTPERKFRAVFEMWEFGRQQMACGIRMRHPDWSEPVVWEEVRRRLIHGPA